MIVQKRYAASEQATEFLNVQIEDLRTQIEEKERELNRYGSEKDILPLTASEAPTVTRIAEVNRALTDATLDRINKFNTYNQLKIGPPGRNPQRAGGQPDPTPARGIHHPEPAVCHSAGHGQARVSRRCSG